MAMAIAIAFEALENAVNVSSLTDSSAIPSGSDLGLLALAVVRDQDTGSTISSIVFNTSESLVESASADANGLRTRLSAIYDLEAPTAVDAAVVATWSQTITYSGLKVARLTGVHQTDMIGATNTATGSDADPQLSITSTEADSIIVAVAQHEADADTFAVVSGWTEVEDTDIGFVRYLAGHRTAPTVEAYTVGWTGDGPTSGDWSMVAVEILNPAAARRTSVGVVAGLRPGGGI